MRKTLREKTITITIIIIIIIIRIIQGRNGKQKDTGIYGNRMQKITREKITVQLEEINQKVLAKEGD